MLPAVTHFTVNFTIFCPTTDEEKGKLASYFKKNQDSHDFIFRAACREFHSFHTDCGKNVCLDVYLHEIKENQFLSPL